MQIIKRTFNEQPYQFRHDGWINATIAAKRFGKLVNEWLRLSSTQTYIEALENDNESSTGNSRSALVKTVALAPMNGGGTWIHPDLAVVFARWLDVKFAVWCDRQIKDIINGKQPIKEVFNEPRVDVEEFKAKGEVMNVKLTVLDTAMKTLGVWDNSKLKVVTSVLKKSAFADLIEHLPQYTEDQATLSLTHLLKEHTVRLPTEKTVVLSTRAVNRLLEQHGFIKQLSRASRSADGSKFFWSVTGKGRPKYGVNKVHIDNPNETQPHWYKDSFPELMERVGLDVA